MSFIELICMEEHPESTPHTSKNDFDYKYHRRPLSLKSEAYELVYGFKWIITKRIVILASAIILLWLVFIYILYIFFGSSVLPQSITASSFSVYLNLIGNSLVILDLNYTDGSVGIIISIYKKIILLACFFTYVQIIGLSMQRVQGKKIDIKHINTRVLLSRWELIGIFIITLISSYLFDLFKIESNLYPVLWSISVLLRFFLYTLYVCIFIYVIPNLIEKKSSITGVLKDAIITNALNIKKVLSSFLWASILLAITVIVSIYISVNLLNLFFDTLNLTHNFTVKISYAVFALLIFYTPFIWLIPYMSLIIGVVYRDIVSNVE